MEPAARALRAAIARLVLIMGAKCPLGTRIIRRPEATMTRSRCQLLPLVANTRLLARLGFRIGFGIRLPPVPRISRVCVFRPIVTTHFGLS